MRSQWLLLLVAGIGLTSCNKITESMDNMEYNRQTIDISTQSIEENTRAIEDANRSIAENTRQLHRINETLKKASAG